MALQLTGDHTEREVGEGWGFTLGASERRPRWAAEGDGPPPPAVFGSDKIVDNSGYQVDIATDSDLIGGVRPRR